MSDVIQTTPGNFGLRVSIPPDWQYIPAALGDEGSRVWSISSDFRERFGETVVESWGSIDGDIPHLDLAHEFDDACASLPGWQPTVSHSWTEGAIVYTLVSGMAAVGELVIESTSVIALRTSGLMVVANQAVVTTFAENRERHVESLRHIRSTSSTIAEWWYV